MKLKVYDDSQNYTATVINLPVKQKVDGLDNLVKVTVFGNDVLVSKDSDPNDLYIFFPAESKLSPEFCKANNLFRDVALNADNTQKGFFELHGRVKALKIRGVISTGFIIPATSLMDVLPNWENSEPYCNLEIGDEFNEIDGVEICRKYIPKNSVTPGTAEPKSKQDKLAVRFDKLVPNQFKLHGSTAPLAKNLHALKLDDVISITNKMHGTSAVFSNILTKRELTWYEKLAKRLGIKLVETEYGNVYSSRTVIKNRYINKEQKEGYYGKDNDIWSVVNEEVKELIEPGLTLYGEIVGYLPSGGMIQKGYDYGLYQGNWQFLVYRITYTKPDGNAIEFSWGQIKDYCEKYGLVHVQEFYYGKLSNWPGTNGSVEEFLDHLSLSYHMEKNDPDCKNKVPFEGVVVRVDKLDSFSAFKVKCKAFLKHETDDLDKGVVSLEEQN